MNYRKLLIPTVAMMTAAAISQRANAQQVVYDNVSNAEANTGATDDGNDFALLGSIYTSKTKAGKTTYTAVNDNAGGGLFALEAGTTSITGFDLFPTVFVTNASNGNLSTGAAYNYSGLQVTMYVWGGVNLGTVNSSNPAFSDLLGTASFTDYEGTGAFENGEIYNYEDPDPGTAPGFSLSTPISVAGAGTDTAGEPVVGISYVVDATNGSNAATATYAPVSGIGATFTYGSPATVGDMSTPGTSTFNTAFYFSDSGEQTGNFKEGPFTFTDVPTDNDLALRVYGNVAAVPEPGSLLGLGLAGGVLLGRRRTRQASI
jgi:hypothetical protein